MRILTISTICTLFASTAVAQQVIEESFSDRAAWSHNGGTWNDGIASTASKFNKVDQLVSAQSFTYTRVPLQLPAGTYVAVARLAKNTNTNGSADMDLKMLIPTFQTLRMPISEQRVGAFRHSRALTFTLDTPTAVIFVLENTDTSVTKLDYLFDSFYVGAVPGGRAVLVESLDRRWGHSHGTPHYETEVPESSATFGHIEQMGPQSGNGLWWFDWSSEVKQFSPGLHTFNIRIRKTLNGGYAPFDLWYTWSTDGGATWNKSAVYVWEASTQIVGRWVNSPNIPFTVGSSNDLFRFFWQKTGGAGNGPKHSYDFDSFAVRRGEFTSIGASCMKSGDAFFDAKEIPQLGHTLTLRVRPINTAVMLSLGLSNPDLDMAIFGWPGCTLNAQPLITLPMPWSRGFARLEIPIPTTQSLVGVPFFMQGYKVSPSNGIVTTNGRRGQIGN